MHYGNCICLHNKWIMVNRLKLAILLSSKNGVVFNNAIILLLYYNNYNYPRLPLSINNKPSSFSIVS